MPNVMAAQSNIGGTLCESSLIPFLESCRKVWLKPAAGVPCSNTANIRERKTWTVDAKWILHLLKYHLGAKAPKNVYTVYQSRRRPKTEQSLVGLRTATSLHKRNQNTKSVKKFAGVPQTGKPISAVSGPTFTILRGHLQEILLFNQFFSNCRYVP